MPIYFLEIQEKNQINYRKNNKNYRKLYFILIHYAQDLKIKMKGDIILLTHEKMKYIQIIYVF